MRGVRTQHILLRKKELRTFRWIPYSTLITKWIQTESLS